MPVYYNENDKFCVAWLRALIAGGHIAHGVVDDRSIVDVRAADLDGFGQCHFFAGIGVWSYALRSAGWSDEREVWTGSCPCQPFSTAGNAAGLGDGRHLWPHLARLIGERRPVAFLGEQVASADGLAWLDFVCADLEAAGYRVGALDLCAAGFGAPHKRQRLFFAADHHDEGMVADSVRDAARQHAGKLSGDETQYALWSAHGDHRSGHRGNDDSMADTELARSQGRLHRRADSQRRDIDGHAGCGSPARSACNGFWRDAEWLACTDAKSRAVEPGTFPLAHGVAGKLGRLRGYGNAIVAPVAIEFIRAYMSEVKNAAA